MSPALREIGSSGAQISANKPLLVETFLGRLPNGKESIVASSSSDAIDVEISSSQLKDRSFGTSRADLLHEDEGPADSFDILGNRRGTCNTMDSGKVSDGRTRDPGSDLDTEMLSIPSSRYEGLKFPIEGKILPKEKACTFFTLPLSSFSACRRGKFRSFSDPDFLLGLDSLARDINAGVSDVEARNLFAEACCLEELFCLFEEFLLDGKSMVYADLPSEPLSGGDSMIDILPGGVNIKSASKSASSNLLVALLRSLRMHGCDTVSALPVLHIFACVAGEKFLSLHPVVPCMVSHYVSTS
uniref:Uncharacterized protein n=1 Tax=Populus alba TaxID=43335 RepID=A0A4U5QLF3_POPAL|nr:hypothetical protein D5086_0000071370 [Populus alba]